MGLVFTPTPIDKVYTVVTVYWICATLMTTIILILYTDIYISIFVVYHWNVNLIVFSLNVKSFVCTLKHCNLTYNEEVKGCLILTQIWKR